MIQLTEEQIRQLREQEQKPARVIDPSTGTKFVLVTEEYFKWIKKLTAPFDRGWDDPKMDVYDQLYGDAHEPR